MSNALSIRDLRASLDRIADSLRTDADRLAALSQSIYVTASEHPEATPADFAPAVLDAVFSALNNSSHIGAAHSIATAVRAAR